MTDSTSVLFIHGTRSSSAIWEKQERAMQDLGYHTYALDLPGHGANMSESFTINRSFEMISEQINRLGGKVVLVGLSLGGYVCLAYAAQHPDKVEAVLAAGCSTETARFATRAYRTVTTAGAQTWRHVRSAMSRHVHIRVPNKPSWDVVTQMLGEVSQVSSLANLRALTMPVWLVSGRWCPLRLGEFSSLKARPDARHFIIPKAGHDVNLHAPHAFNVIMANMLGSLPATAR